MSQRGRRAHRSLSVSDTLANIDDYDHDRMNKTNNDHASGASATLAHDGDDSLTKSNKKNKQKGFWKRLWTSCFKPSLSTHDAELDADPRVGVGKATKSAKKSEKSEDDDKADSNKLTDETAVASPSPAATRNSVNLGNSTQNHQNPPHLMIPNAPIVITAPSTPAYNTFDLDADPETVIPPTPSKGTAHLLPVDETEGVTSGAVQAPGSTAIDDSDRGTFTDDEFHDAKEEDEHIDAEEMRLIMNCGSGIPIVDGKPKPLLPPIAERHKGRKCLVLDMDETLLHSSFKLMPQHDFTVPVEIEWQWHNAYVLKRPGVEEFLRKMGEIYEVIVYTASVSKYADPVLDKVDVHKAVTHRLFRESCYNHRGNYVKDLSMLGRPLDTCIILDNSPASYLFNPTNAVPVTTWFNDPLDTELTDLIGFLTDLAPVSDVRPLLARDC